MVSIHTHLTIKDGKMDQSISLLEEILVFIKSSEPECLLFNITKFVSNKFYLREAYKYGAAALVHLKNMRHMIPKLFEVTASRSCFRNRTHERNTPRGLFL